jgi:hypothetical protein
MSENETFYMLFCRACDGGGLPLPLPFPSAEARGQWAAAHTQGTGHDSWLVFEQRVRPSGF